MPIYKISGQKVQKVRPKKFSGSDREKKLQNLVENNLKEIFEMDFIATEYSTTHGGRIDTLALDSDNRPVIIEYKDDKSSTILLQGLYYMDWIVANKAEFEKQVRIQLKKDVDVNWQSGVRLILIARSFEIWDKFAVNRIKEDVELYEYTLYENNELKLEKSALPKDFTTPRKSSITRTKEYTVEDRLKIIKSEPILKIVQELREKLNLISDDISEKVTQYYILYKSTINFASINTQAKQYWFEIKLPKVEVEKSYQDLDIRPHKDEVWTHIRCNEDTDIDQLVELAKQAYENTL